MANQTRLQKFMNADWGFVGVPVFFIVHGYVQFIQEVAFTALVLPFIKLLIEAEVLFVISRWLLGSTRKANLFTALLFIIALFFGVGQDFFGQFRFIADLSKFSYFIILTFLVIGIVFFWFKKTKRPLNRMALFLHTLLLIYIFIDAGRLVIRLVTPSNRGSDQLSGLHLSPCDTCHKPSVYLVLLDMYWGSTALKEYFQYDNTGFENFLRDQGFHVVTASHSNYAFTNFSMASLLSMQYLGDIGEPYYTNHYGFVTTIRTIKYNPVTAYFKSMGYDITNLSIFDMDGIPAGYSSGALPEKAQLVMSQTMYYRIRKNLLVYLREKGYLHKTANKEETGLINKQETLMQHTLAQSAAAMQKPVFTYLHLYLPHQPFLLDSNGRRTHYTENESKLSADNKDDLFLQYEVYANKRISRFIGDLKKATGNKAVILLMSDHGYHEARTRDSRLLFYNLNALYLPDKNYAAWYKGMSNVNQFRALFNTVFHQQMPLQPDTIVYNR